MSGKKKRPDLRGTPTCPHGRYLLNATPCLRCIEERRAAINAWAGDDPPACSYPGCGCRPAFSCPAATNFDRREVQA